MKNLIIAVVMMASASLFAQSIELQVLTPLKKDTNYSFDKKDLSILSCKELLDELNEYQRNRDQLDYEVENALSQISRVILNWYNGLSRYYGQNVFIQYGSFENMYHTSGNIAGDVRYYSDKSSDLRNYMDDIIYHLRGCVQ